jgi:DNA ligase D-like protein (predicted ligase)
VKAGFIEPMLLLRKESLPDSPEWLYEIKLDGYRAIAAKSGGKVQLRSRNDNDFSTRYPGIAQGLASMPDETVVDGEVVALDEEGRPSFNVLQNFASSNVPIIYYVFDLLVLSGRDLMNEPLTERRALLEKKVLPKLREPVRYSTPLQATLPDLVHSVKTHGLEGLVAKRRDSRYEPGKRSGAWQKMRINRVQDFVIGGYTIGGTTFDAVVFGYYEGESLIYVARTRNGFVPSIRASLMKRFRELKTGDCPFVNLPESKSGRWGQGLTKEKMKECRWVKPELVAQFEYLEWTPDNHLRHSRFVSMREDSKPRTIRRESLQPRETST